MKERRIIVAASALIGLSVSGLIYFFLTTENYNLNKVVFTLMSFIGIVIPMIILINHHAKKLK